MRGLRLEDERRGRIVKSHSPPSFPPRRLLYRYREQSSEGVKAVQMQILQPTAANEEQSGNPRGLARQIRSQAEEIRRQIERDSSRQLPPMRQVQMRNKLFHAIYRQTVSVHLCL